MSNRTGFKFLELIPELRNIVYRELLVFDSGGSCQPHILASSKAVNAEASAILYCENLIHIEIKGNDVYVRHMPCEKTITSWQGSRIRALK